MATLKYDNFDGVTAPSLPSDWVGSTSDFETAASGVTPSSAPNVLRIKSASAGASYAIANTGTGAADDGSGNTRVSVRFRVDVYSASTVAQVIARVVANASNWTTIQCYHAAFSRGATNTLQLFRRSAGSSVQQGSTVTISGFTDGREYELEIETTSTGALAVRLRDTVTGHYCNSSGTFAAAFVSAISATDGSPLSGAGYGGIRMGRGNSTDNAYLDNWRYENTSVAADIAVNDAAITYSPCNWEVSGSSYAQTATPGAWASFRFTGENLYLATAAPGFTGNSLHLKAVVDGVTTFDAAIAGGVRAPLARALADATHDVTLYYRSNDPSQDVWTTPAMALRATAYRVDTGKAISAATGLPSSKLLILGDSTTYGISANAAGTSSTANSDSTKAPGFAIGTALGARVGILGYGSQGYGKTGMGNIPKAEHAWSSHRSGVSRLSGGLFAEMPDRIMLVWGTADCTGRVSDGTNPTGTAVRNGLNTTLAAVRAAAGTKPIYVVLPPMLGYVGTPHTELRNGVLDGFDLAAGTRALVGTSGEVSVYRGGTDTNSYLITLGATIASTLYGTAAGASSYTVDGVHYTQAGADAVAALIVAGIGLAGASTGRTAKHYYPGLMRRRRRG